jgi:hypothetical protein
MSEFLPDEGGGEFSRILEFIKQEKENTGDCVTPRHPSSNNVDLILFQRN